MEWFHLHGRELSPEDRKLVSSSIMENKELCHSLMELFYRNELYHCECFSRILDAVSPKTIYNLLNMLLEQVLEESPSLGGLVLFGSCDDESPQNPCIPLPKVQLSESDTYMRSVPSTHRVHIQSWLTLVSPDATFQNHSLTLFAITLGSTKLAVRLLFPSRLEPNYALSLCGEQFPIPLSFASRFAPHLLTLSISSTAIQLFIDQHAFPSFPYSSFKHADKLFVTLGAGLSGDSQSLSQIPTSPFVLVHNVSILSGSLSTSYLSTLFPLLRTVNSSCSLGPSASGRAVETLSEPAQLFPPSPHPDSSTEEPILVPEHCSIDCSEPRAEGWVCSTNQTRSTIPGAILNAHPNVGRSFVSPKGVSLQVTKLPLL